MTWRRSDRIAAKAAQWVVLVDSERFDAAQAARLARWLEQSSDHAEAFRLASRAWGDLDGLAKLRLHPGILGALSASATASPARVGPDRRALLVGAGAAGVVAVLGGYALLAPGAAAAYETGIGERSEALLPDGTRIHLNAVTRIEARIGAERRDVHIVRGEALFEIAPSAAGAFKITSSEGEIEAASGTVLVKVFPHGLRVALLSGAVRASRPGLFGSSAPIDAAANDQIFFADDAIMIEAVAADRLARAALWREGVLAFDETSLAEATADVTRQTGVRFVFEDPALASMRIGGLIRADDLDGFLELLSANLAIRSERRGNDVTLSSTSAL